MKKLLVTGATGLLGASILYELHNYFEIYAIYNEHNIRSRYAKYLQLDLTDKEKTENCIGEIRPDIIIHTVAMTNVDLCESKPELAKEINVVATNNIAEICKKRSIKLVHISTDYVFDGKKGDYTEIDKTNPLSVYAKTKLQADKIVRNIENSLIIRTSIYGWNVQKKQSIIEYMVSNLKQGKEISALIDQETSMIFVNDLARILKETIEKDLTGTYNIASSTSASKYQFAFKVADIFGLNKSLIKPITTEELAKKVKWKAERPKNTSLDVSKIQKSIKMPKIEQSLIHMKELENTYMKNFISYN